MEIVGEGCTPDEGMALFKAYTPDVTLIDYSLADQTGFQLAEELPEIRYLCAFDPD
jgi:DNA-binding NarL/FixJ family response regulator